ncbi:hypothetical protein [Paenibacillus sp. J2TS4]|uniref:hypothetical protein n=1 Tax=Paenibacillus sp. J2TS4 TaxID=2807194 RepID=UPI001BD1073D|nr:hypothetical protein [Paenibacillus sp. J2TS4]
MEIKPIQHKTQRTEAVEQAPGIRELREGATQSKAGSNSSGSGTVKPSGKMQKQGIPQAYYIVTNSSPLTDVPRLDVYALGNKVGCFGQPTRVVPRRCLTPVVS